VGKFIGDFLYRQWLLGHTLKTFNNRNEHAKKLFTAVIDSVTLYPIVFVTISLFDLSLTFAGKAGGYPENGATLQHSTLNVSPSLHRFGSG